MELSPTNRVVAFPVQSDMLNGRVWVRPDNAADVVSESGVYVDSLDGMRGGYGGEEWNWKFRALTPKMALYLKTTVFGSRRGGPVTVRTFNRETGEWETKWSDGKLPDPRTDATLVGGGYDDYPIAFINGASAPEVTGAFHIVGSLTPTAHVQTAWSACRFSKDAAPLSTVTPRLFPLSVYDRAQPPKVRKSLQGRGGVGAQSSRSPSNRFPQ